MPIVITIPSLITSILWKKWKINACTKLILKPHCNKLSIWVCMRKMYTREQNLNNAYGCLKTWSAEVTAAWQKNRDQLCDTSPFHTDHRSLTHSITSFLHQPLQFLLLCNTGWPVSLTTSEALIIICLLARGKFFARSPVYFREQAAVGGCLSEPSLWVWRGKRGKAKDIKIDDRLSQNMFTCTDLSTWNSLSLYPKLCNVLKMSIYMCMTVLYTF